MSHNRAMAYNVFLTCPTYDRRIDTLTSKILWQRSSQRHQVDVYSASSSLLTNCCNGLLRDALNKRAAFNFTWFAMLHNDVAPQDWWLDTLIAEAEAQAADMLCTVIPVKDARGLTSTAIADPSLKRCFCRLTQAQICHPQFPTTFDIHGAADALERLPEPLRVADVPRSILWCNTGCFVMRLDRDWDWSKVCFRMEDGLQLVDGVWKDFNISEDWCFSQAVAEQGGKVMATKIVSVLHRGATDYPSNQVWGQPRDLG
jgi:hypothetical protein